MRSFGIREFKIIISANVNSLLLSTKLRIYYFSIVSYQNIAFNFSKKHSGSDTVGHPLSAGTQNLALHTKSLSTPAVGWQDLFPVMMASFTVGIFQIKSYLNDVICNKIAVFFCELKTTRNVMSFIALHNWRYIIVVFDPFFRSSESSTISVEEMHAGDNAFMLSRCGVTPNQWISEYLTLKINVKDIRDVAEVRQPNVTYRRANASKKLRF